MSYKFKIAVAFPFSRYVPPEWALSIANLQYPMNTSHTVIMTKGVKRDEARNYLAQKAIEMNAEYLFFIDDDTCPPPFTINALLRELDQADDDVAVCGGIYTSKADPAAPIVFMEQHAGPFWKWKYGEVFQCWGLGTGCMMIRTSVFDKISKPWFRDIESIDDIGPDDNVEDLDGNITTDVFNMTDDLYFCKKINDAGFKVLAHGGVLPLHFNQSGRGFGLNWDTRPLLGVNPEHIWYHRLLNPQPVEYHGA